MIMSISHPGLYYHYEDIHNLTAFAFPVEIKYCAPGLVIITRKCINLYTPVKL